MNRPYQPFVVQPTLYKHLQNMSLHQHCPNLNCSNKKILCFNPSQKNAKSKNKCAKCKTELIHVCPKCQCRFTFEQYLGHEKVCNHPAKMMTRSAFLQIHAPAKVVSPAPVLIQTKENNLVGFAQLVSSPHFQQQVLQRVEGNGSPLRQPKCLNIPAHLIDLNATEEEAEKFVNAYTSLKC